MDDVLEQEEEKYNHYQCDSKGHDDVWRSNLGFRCHFQRFENVCLSRDAGADHVVAPNARSKSMGGV